MERGKSQESSHHPEKKYVDREVPDGMESCQQQTAHNQTERKAWGLDSSPVLGTMR